MDSKLNKRAQYAIFLPNIFVRLEECVLNAQTDLAKRRLVQVAVVLGGMKSLEEENFPRVDWNQPL